MQAIIFVRNCHFTLHILWKVSWTGGNQLQFSTLMSPLNAPVAHFLDSLHTGVQKLSSKSTIT